jgi:hypothetical protein
MKKFINLALMALTVAICFSSCLKDVGKKHYKIYTPIIETTSSLRAKVKSAAGIDVANAGKLFVIGNYVFLNEKEKGIHVIDNTNPANPINKAFITIPGNTDLWVSNNILYANCYTDFLAIDVTDINNITTTKVIEDIFIDVRFINGYATSQGSVIIGWTVRDTSMEVEIAEGQGIWSNGKYITNNWSGGVWLSGLPTPTSNPGGGSQASSTGKAGSMSRFTVVNNHLYAVSNSTLNAIDISNATQPTIASKLSIGWNIETIYPFKDKLFIGSQTGMFVYGLSNPTQPTYISSFSHARLCDPVIADDDYAYITLHAGTFCQGTQNELDVVKISDLSNPTLVKQISLTKPQGLSKDGNILFVCDDNAGIRVFDATNPENPILLQTIPLNAAYDIICNNGIAMVSAKDGLHQYNYSNTNNIIRLSSFLFAH